MKKSFNYFLLIIFFVTQHAIAQKKEIKSKADLPVLTFSTALLQKDDSAQINLWMKNVASVELKHVDSIFDNYNIKNSRVLINLIVDRVFYNFILNNWDNVKNGDTVFKSLEFFPEYSRQVGLIELTSYAKVKQRALQDFDKDYVPAFLEAVTPFEKEIKRKIATDAMSRSSYFFKLYNDALSKIKENPLAGDTSIQDIVSGYVYRQLQQDTKNLLYDYVNKSIVENFSRADTLRGTINVERSWWDVLRYDITIKPDEINKTISGKNLLQYKVLADDHPAVMQIDLQTPLLIDSILFNSAQKLTFIQDGNAWHVTVPQQKKDAVNNLLICYHGKVQEAVNPPWEGGWTWKKDKDSSTLIEVTCQGKGASVWFPCKDHQGDEPDNGASLSIIIPDSLVGVSNGRLVSAVKNNDGTTTYKWAVVNPINNYLIIPYIGKYVRITDEYMGEKGKLDLSYWVLNYNADTAKKHLVPEVKKMLKAFEYWFGQYPFYEDGYKLVEAPAGMEHQSAIAYSNGYQFGAEGNDYSGTGWGMKWDYIIVHESAHEWWGNNITTKDMADMWVHEGFGCYAETLYTEYYYGKQAGNEYNYGLRKGIENIYPVIGYYGVNDNISGRNQDMYSKGANILHTIRHSIDNDSAFRLILRGLQKTFYHQTVTTAQIENYITQQARYDYSKVFDQYLRNSNIPGFEFYLSADKKKMFYRYTNCIDGFNLPLIFKNNNTSLKIIPAKQWGSIEITAPQVALLTASSIEKMYYLNVKKVSGR